MVPAATAVSVDGPALLSSQVLVLNQNYEPLNVTNVRRALSLLVLNKAEMLESDGAVIRSERLTLPMPTVVRLLSYVRRPPPVLKLTRKSIFARDDHRCQYCGRRDGGLTIDHVVPKCRGGKYEWENLVTCCLKCNNKKGNRLPEEVGLRLIRKPRRPRYTPYISLPKFLAAYREGRWTKYLEPFVDIEEIRRLVAEQGK